MDNTVKNPESGSLLFHAEKWMPGIQVMRAYKRRWLPRDILAGLVLSALLVPQGMAYAELAGLPPTVGLYATVVCLFAYALLGPSPYLVIGPDSALSPMIGAAILPLVAGDDERAIALAGMLALFVGVVCTLAGIAKFGFVAVLISKPLRIGYLAGLSVTIFVSQLPKLFGFSVEGGNLFQDARDFLQNIDQTNLYAMGVGFLTLTILLICNRWLPKLPGVLLGVVGAIVVTSLFDLEAKGVEVIGMLPQGFPRPSLPAVELSDLIRLAAAAMGITLVAIGDTISTSAGFASRRGYRLDSNQELLGIGAANLLTGLFQGFPVSTSSSRTAVAEQSGAKTQLTGIVAGLMVLAMLLFVPGIVRNLPQPALAAVVISASIALLNVGRLRKLLKQRRSEFLLAMACALSVAFVGILEGIIIAIVISILQFFERLWRPHWAVMGKPEDVPGYHDTKRYPDAKLIPGLLMIRWDAPLFFANANIFRKIVREQIEAAEWPVKWVVIAAQPITDVDTTAADMLVDLDQELNVAGQHLAFAELKDPVRDKIERYGLLETIDDKHFYPTIKRAVKAYRKQVGEED